MLLLVLAIPVAGLGGYLLASGSNEDSGPAIPKIAGAKQAADFAASEASHNYAKGTPGFARAAAISAMNLVETNVSAPRFAVLQDQGKTVSDPAKSWAAQAGLCQGSSEAYQQVMRELWHPPHAG